MMDMNEREVIALRAPLNYELFKNYYSVTDNSIALFAERRNKKEVFGYYGGDAYPIVSVRSDSKTDEVATIKMQKLLDCDARILSEGQPLLKPKYFYIVDALGDYCRAHPIDGRMPSPRDFANANVTFDYKCKNVQFGVAISADGLGSGAFVHKSLEQQLAHLPTYSQKLEFFLRTLYGEEIFEDEEAFAYAMKCFAPIPPDSYYTTNSGNAQICIPFWERDSQSLASRMVCVGIFLNFHKFLYNERYGFVSKDSVHVGQDKFDIRAKSITITPVNKTWSEQGVINLRDDIQNYVEQLKEKCYNFFDLDEAGIPAKEISYYFLPTTFAGWFYVCSGSGKNKTTSAVCVSIGDAHGYVIAPHKDFGVRMVTMDDSYPNDDMRACFMFGKRPNTKNPDRHDNRPIACLVNLSGPCALLTCSDGIYDTCGSFQVDNNKDYIYPEGHSESFFGTIDIAFEHNLWELLKVCYSADDVAQLILKNFYIHSSKDANDGVVSARRLFSVGAEKGEAKPDDSGTFALCLTDPDMTICQFLDEIRAKCAQTRFVPYIDRMWKFVKEKEVQCCHVNLPEKESEENTIVLDLASKDAIVYLVRALMDEAINQVKEGQTTIWNSPDPIPQTPFKRNQFFSRNRVRAVNLALEDSKEIAKEGGKIPEDWTSENHVIVDEGILHRFKDAIYEMEGVPYSLDEYVANQIAQLADEEENEELREKTLRNKSYESFCEAHDGNQYMLFEDAEAVPVLYEYEGEKVPSCYRIDNEAYLKVTVYDRNGNVVQNAKTSTNE